MARGQRCYLAADEQNLAGCDDTCTAAVAGASYKFSLGAGNNT
jgi:hypothetical protein